MGVGPAGACRRGRGALPVVSTHARNSPNIGLLNLSDHQLEIYRDPRPSRRTFVGHGQAAVQIFREHEIVFSLELSDSISGSAPAGTPYSDPAAPDRPRRTPAARPAILRAG